MLIPNTCILLGGSVWRSEAAGAAVLIYGAPQNGIQGFSSVQLGCMQAEVHGHARLPTDIPVHKHSLRESSYATERPHQDLVAA
jgi:hypothetical protein